MKKKYLSVTEARKQFADITKRAEYGREATVILRRGEPTAAVVPVSRLRQLEEAERQSE